MKAVIMMFDTLSRRFISTYNKTTIQTPNFDRLLEHATCFDNFYSGSLPCMPARREMHTGRYNFLHRGWGPIEPYDFSCLECLNKNNIYTHIITDHSHYWEDGGATYLTRFKSWEGFRGQEGDRFKPLLKAAELNIPKQLSSTKKGESFYYNWQNRSTRISEEDYSSVKTIKAGCEFLEEYHDIDNWFLQLECFDPHEPFDVPQKYLDMVNDEYRGDYFDWPAYAPLCESEEEKQHCIKRYQALILMCDHYLGKVLDTFDKYNLWEDTMLIVNTDHGFLMGEHDWWGKNIQPCYNEVVHLPFFYYDPRQKALPRTANLAQTIDIAPTLLDYFNVKIPLAVQGLPLNKIIDGTSTHEAVLFGCFGGHVNVCDGNYTYMRSTQNIKNQPLFEYTLMPTMMRGFISKNNLKQSELINDFNFVDMNILKLPGSSFGSSYRYGNKLFDISNDYAQLVPLDNPHIELSMINKMVKLMQANEAPLEQYIRLGIRENMSEAELLKQRHERMENRSITLKVHLTNLEEKQLIMLKEMLPDAVFETLVADIEKSKIVDATIEKYIKLFVAKMNKPGMESMFMNMLKYADKED